MASSRPKTYNYGSVEISLENSIIPKEKLENTPSVLDGLNIEIETDLRIVGCEYIQMAGILLKVPQVAMATGQVLFQRFYYCKSFIRHDVEVYAMACLFLAAKIEECPRRIRDVINVFHHIKQKRNLRKCTSNVLHPQPVVDISKGNWQLGLDDGSALVSIETWTKKPNYYQPTAPMEYLGNTYFTLKNLVIKAERRILKELGFCVHVQHPHKVVITFLQVLDSEKNQALAQLAWNFMNDALRTNVFVRYQPGTIACACIFLSARQLKIPLPSRPPWWELFDGGIEDIEDVCLTLLKLYLRPKISLQILNKAVDRLKKILPAKKPKETESTQAVDEKNKHKSSGSTFSQPGSPSSNVSPVTEGAKSRGEDMKKNGSTKLQSQGFKPNKKSSKTQEAKKDVRKESRNQKPTGRSPSPSSEKSQSASGTESESGDSSDSDSASADSGSSTEESRKRKEKISRQSRRHVDHVDDRRRKKHGDIRSASGRKLYKSKSDTNSYRRERDRSRSPYRRSRSRSRSRDRRTAKLKEKRGRRGDIKGSLSRNGDYKLSDKYDKRERSGRR